MREVAVTKHVAGRRPDGAPASARSGLVKQEAPPAAARLGCPGRGGDFGGLAMNRSVPPLPRCLTVSAWVPGACPEAAGRRTRTGDVAAGPGRCALCMKATGTEAPAGRR